MPTIRVRVVCGLLETMASFSARSRLSRVDLPALGRPTSATAPERSPPEEAPGSVKLAPLLLLGQPLDPHPPRAPVVGALHHEAQPLHLDGLPHPGHVAEEAERQSAH